MLCLVAALVTAVLPTPLPAADADADTGAWTTLALIKPLAAGRWLGLDLQTRHSEDFARLERFLLRPYFGYRDGSGLDYRAGYDAHFIESPRSLLEHRLWQQIGTSGQAGRFSHTLYFRVEERFIEDLGGVTVRVRPSFEVRYALEAAGYLRVQNEVHVNVNEVAGGPRRGFDQNRLFLVYGRRLGPRVSAEIGYHLQYFDRVRDVARHQVLFTLGVTLPD